jgi:predicted O-methyltransferase YrrM
VILPNDIQTAVTVDEATQLARLAEGKDVLEMGAHFGFSTVVLASVARRVWSVDWHGGDAHAGLADSWDTYRANLNLYGVRDKVQVCKGWFQNEIPKLVAAGVTVDGAFIDGQHDEDSVRDDLALALTVVKPGGFVAFHDYGRDESTGNPGFAITPVADEFGVDGVVGHLAWGTVPALAPVDR